MDTNTVLIVGIIVLTLMVLWLIKRRAARLQRWGAHAHPDVQRSNVSHGRTTHNSAASQGSTNGGEIFAVIRSNGTRTPISKADLYDRLQPYYDLKYRHESLFARVAEAYDMVAPTDALMREAENVASEFESEEKILSQLYIETDIANDSEAKQFEETVFTLSGELSDFVFNVEWLREFLDDEDSKKHTER